MWCEHPLQLQFNQEHWVCLENMTVAAQIQSKFICTVSHKGSKKGLHVSQHALYGKQRISLKRSAVHCRANKHTNNFLVLFEPQTHMTCMYFDSVGKEAWMGKTETQRERYAKLMLRFKHSVTQWLGRFKWFLCKTATLHECDGWVAMCEQTMHYSHTPKPDGWRQDNELILAQFKSLYSLYSMLILQSVKSNISTSCDNELHCIDYYIWCLHIWQKKISIFLIYICSQYQLLTY